MSSERQYCTVYIKLSGLPEEAGGGGNHLPVIHGAPGPPPGPDRAGRLLKKPFSPRAAREAWGGPSRVPRGSSNI